MSFELKMLQKKFFKFRLYRLDAGWEETGCHGAAGGIVRCTCEQDLCNAPIQVRIVKTKMLSLKNKFKNLLFQRPLTSAGAGYPPPFPAKYSVHFCSLAMSTYLWSRKADNKP